MKVFLGGTCGSEKENGRSTWRDELIPFLQIDYFNPYLAEGVSWDSKAQEAEENAKLECDIFLYAITKEMVGFWSIVEIMQDILINARNPIVHINTDGFNKHQKKSLTKFATFLADYISVYIDTNYEQLANELNNL